MDLSSCRQSNSVLASPSDVNNVNSVGTVTAEIKMCIQAALESNQDALLRFKNTVLKLEERVGQYQGKNDDIYRSFLGITHDLNGSCGFVSVLVKTIHDCGYALSTSWYDMFPPSNTDETSIQETDEDVYNGEDDNIIDRDWATVVAKGVVTNTACFKPTDPEEKRKMAQLTIMTLAREILQESEFVNFCAITFQSPQRFFSDRAWMCLYGFPNKSTSKIINEYNQSNMNGNQIPIIFRKMMRVPIDSIIPYGVLRERLMMAMTHRNRRIQQMIVCNKKSDRRLYNLLPMDCIAWASTPPDTTVAQLVYGDNLEEYKLLQTQDDEADDGRTTPDPNNNIAVAVTPDTTACGFTDDA